MLLLALLAILVAAVLPSVVAPTLIWRTAEPELSDLGSVGSFALIDESGQPFTEQALRGKVSLVNFVFTRCDTICPVVSMKMERLQEKTFDASEYIKLVSFSVDPAYDTPERLAEFARRYKADPTRWRFVTGPVDAMRKLVEGPFMNSMINEGVTASGAPAISHSGYFLLVDTRGTIRGAYDSTDVKRLDQMMRDARYLARTQR